MVSFVSQCYIVSLEVEGFKDVGMTVSRITKFPPQFLAQFSSYFLVFFLGSQFESCIVFKSIILVNILLHLVSIFTFFCILVVFLDHPHTLKSITLLIIIVSF